MYTNPNNAYSRVSAEHNLCSRESQTLGDIAFIRMLAWQNSRLNQMRGITQFIYLRHIKKKKKKWHMTHVAGEEGKSDWSPLHLQNDCFFFFFFPCDTVRLRHGWNLFGAPSSPCFSIKELEEQRRASRRCRDCDTTDVFRHTHTQTPPPNPYTPPRPFVDLIECAIEMRPFCKPCLTDATFFFLSFYHIKARGNAERKKNAKLSLSPRSACLNKSRRRPPPQKKYIYLST